jgi:hypothetical protein
LAHLHWSCFSFEAGLPDGLFSKPKIPLWINIGGPQNGKCWYILWLCIWTILRPFGIFYVHLVNVFYVHLVYVFYVHLVYFMSILYTLLPFGIFCGHFEGTFPPFLYVVPRKNLANPAWKMWIQICRYFGELCA